MFRVLSVAILGMIAYAVIPASAQQLRAKVVELKRGGAHDLSLLGGPPETVNVKSGLVTLQAGQSVGKHSTSTHEEVLVILQGQGEMKFADGTTLGLDPDHVLYCPPQTTHDVTNTGSGILRYVYIAAAARSY